MNNKLKNNKKLIKIMVNSLKIGMEEDETRASINENLWNHLSNKNITILI